MTTNQKNMLNHLRGIELMNKIEGLQEYFGDLNSMYKRPSSEKVAIWHRLKDFYSPDEMYVWSGNCQTYNILMKWSNTHFKIITPRHSYDYEECNGEWLYAVDSEVLFIE